jgi:putative nucleotidyltransferase with HDIG domain
VRYVPISNIESGDVLASTVYGKDIRPLITQGTVLRDAMIQRLESQGYPGLYVVDEDVKDVEIEQGLPEEFKLRNVQRLQQVFEETKHRGLNASLAIDIANSITDEIMHKKNFILQVKDLRRADIYMYQHAINVAMLGVLTARRLGYSQSKIKQVAVGCLLHDIGMALTESSSEHTKIGFDLLRKEPTIPLLSAHMALYHHEPMKVESNGEQVRELVQICAISNQYDHLIHDQSILPYDAIKYVIAQSYSSIVTDAFIANIAPYPIGTKVMLNEKLAGKVIEVSPTFPARPIIKVKAGNIDLRQHPNLVISSIIEDDPKGGLLPDKEQATWVFESKRSVKFDNYFSNVQRQ